MISITEKEAGYYSSRSATLYIPPPMMKRKLEKAYITNPDDFYLSGLSDFVRNMKEQNKKYRDEQRRF